MKGLAVIAVSGAVHGQSINQRTGVVEKYGMPGPNDLVRRCLITGCDWDDANMYWVKFANLQADEAAEVCETVLKPDTPIPAPSEWTAEKDQCKIWLAVLKPLIPNVVEKAPTNGVWITWPETKKNVDGSNIETAVSYRVYRNTGLVNGSIDPLNSFFVVETDNINVLIRKQPIGKQCYAVAAKTALGQSLFTNALCKTMKLPAPTDGKISRPSDGAIEIK